VKLFSQNFNACDHNPPTLQTDGQTTYHDNIALLYASRGTCGRIRAVPSFQLGTLSTCIASRAARSDVDLFISRTARQTRLTNRTATSQTHSTQLKTGKKVDDILGLYVTCVLCNDVSQCELHWNCVDITSIFYTTGKLNGKKSCKQNTRLYNSLN